MCVVKITGWNPGFNKIEFNKFIRNRCGLDLVTTKHCVDDILDNKSVSIKFDDFTEEDFKQLRELGVKLEVEE